MEDNNLVDTVEKLRTEILTHGSHNPRTHFLVLGIIPCYIEDILGADVTGHNNDGIFKIHNMGLGIC